MLVQERLLTADEFIALPEPEDDAKYELVNGRLVRKPAVTFRHTPCASRLSFALYEYAEARGRGLSLGGPDCKVTSDPDTVRIPDAAYIADTQVPAGTPIPEYLHGAAAVMVEVKSKGQSERELRRRMQSFFAAGAEQVWVVRMKDRTVTVYRTGQPAELITEDDELVGDDVLPGFRYPLRRLFDRL